MLDTRWRSGVERGLRPVGARLRQVGISADQVTLLGLAASVACGLVIASGRLGWGAFFLALSGLTDVLDGAVAKSGGTAGPRGAFFDSVCDRVSDGVVLAGAAWYYSGRHPHLAVLAFGVALLSLLVSYERSRAESLGFNGKGGLMERAERMMVLGLGLTFGYLTAALWVLFALTGVTVVQRFLLVWRQATPEVAAGERQASERPARPSWWVTARDARSDESRLAGWRPAARPPGERSRLANWILSARPPAGEGDPRPARQWRSVRSGDARGFGGVGRDDLAGVRSQLRRLRSRTRP
jgi:CDP-diacylglycerol--glycerol-3-phosphate 3-phosphatidyltransferase